MHHRAHLDHVPARPVDDPIGLLHHLPDCCILSLRDGTAGVRERPDLLQSVYDALDELFGVDRRAPAHVLRDGAKLVDRLLCPAERAAHEARRIRARTRAKASS